MKKLIITAVVNFIGVLCFDGLAVQTCFISFSALLRPVSLNSKILAIAMLIFGIGMLLFAYIVSINNYEDWSEDYRNYKKWND